MMARPDELANAQDIERDARFRDKVKGSVMTAASLGASAALSTKVLPFISKYITPDIALKGISKVAPGIGAFLKKGKSMGLDIEEGLQFVKDNFAKQEAAAEKQAAPKNNKNIIEQYSPDLHQFILDEMKSGRSALEAGALARLGTSKGKDFTKAIDKLTKDHKSTWADILKAVYENNTAQPQQGQPNQAQPQAPQPPPQNAAQPPNQQQSTDKWGKIAETLQSLLGS